MGAKGTTMPEPKRHAIRHPEALERLRAGNERFVQNVRSVEVAATLAKRDALATGQAPFAVVLSCSDSRVPTEIVFDCGLGDLFIVRVAGNVVAPSIIGSVEFAAAEFGTELVVVMGHTRCGAVTATLDVLRNGSATASENLRDIVDRIAPSIAELAHGGGSYDDILRAAGHANVRASANHLRHGSRILETLIEEGRLAVIGAEYDLDTGSVDFFEERF
jgi:carbonic anhydrase